MPPSVPRPRSWRGAPALVVQAALASGVLAVTVGGDSAVGAAVAEAAGSVAGDTGDTRGIGGTAAGEAGGSWESAAPEHSVTADLSGILPAGPDAVLADAVAPLLEGTTARLGVAVHDPRTGRTAGYGGAHFDTASIVKVNIVAALLLTAQDEGRELTRTELAEASAAIRYSDNPATDALWQRLGGERGLDAANARLGLTDTRGGGDGHWGLTQTTAADQITLLRAVFGTPSPLTAASRELLQELMGDVVADQRWGISAAAGAGAEGPVEIKNGWLPRSQTLLWDVNSIGRVTVDGKPYLVAVLSDGHASWDSGRTVVEEAARAAVRALRGTTPPA
ncbi:serine hydrolase [Streptomyces sp. YIM 98790]|uniref:serine hydrolase n=1 Tax=Streptomyces sp. YIM 98790 TaxID=2689077 RepID=UPI0014087BA2|nr:serine hydrolase [Streptomyces sp. YIM 98790]